MKSLNKHLQEFGFKPELSFTIDPTGKKEKLFYKNLNKILGSYRYEEYCRIQDSCVDELSMMKFIGGSESLFKFLLSAQIDISEQMFQEILEIIKCCKINPYRILEFGGANGWASDYLINYVFGKVEESVIVDNFPNWSTVNPEIKIHSEDYFDYENDTKFNFIFSILGYSAEDYSSFLEKAISFLSEDGVLILGLRIGNEQSYQKALITIYKLGCHLDLVVCKKITVGNEKFPILTIKKGVVRITKNLELASIRKGFYNLDRPKRIIGYEARVIFELINGGNVLIEKRNYWDDGTWLNMTYLEYNGLVFRVLDNFSNSFFVLEFPILEQITIEEVIENIQFKENYFERSI
jgi:hypothetical protein